MMLASIVGTLSSAAMVMAETAASSGIFSSVTADSISAITDGMKEGFQAALPVVVTVLGLRKAIGAFRGLVRGA